MNSDLLYLIALTEVPYIGPAHARTLITAFGSAKAVFESPVASLEKIEGIGTIRAKQIKDFRAFTNAEKEIRFLHKHQIQALVYNGDGYPKRLMHCYDPPLLLYYKGNAKLDCSRIVAIVGTRSNSAYGKQITEKFVAELASQDILILSGLAMGIDAIAHQAALSNNIPTVGILGHGLNSIYPVNNTALARSMVARGGLLTEFTSATKASRHNFPTRNRIVAGMADAVVVVETGIRGGSMITAELANGYNRDVFAFPGRISDAKSLGCNYLIKSNKAILLSDAAQLMEMMGWGERKQLHTNKQIELFTTLTDDEKTILSILKEKDNVPIDEIYIAGKLNGTAVAAAILSLELQGIIRSLPGKIYSLA